MSDVHFLESDNVAIMKTLCGKDSAQGIGTQACDLVTCEECKKRLSMPKLFAITFGDNNSGTLVDVDEKGNQSVFYFTEDVGKKVIEEFGNFTPNALLEDKSFYLFCMRQERKSCGEINVLSIGDWAKHRETFEELKKCGNG